eukprot:TRINITY_DN4846_c0_g2_i1.p1 TRINITY_DN4846_c0_g2~~TRINITY_DN4846_c0_g2_i1.p1  ORF type:complete len:600 (-),score=152.73 TRINITY_DN4846_c0_g2_i1:239-2038(-)
MEENSNCELNLGQKQTEESFQCKFHPLKKVELFCSSPDCLRPLCSLCKVEDPHKNQDFDVLDAAFDYHWKSVLLHVEAVKPLVSEVDKKLESVKNQAEALENEKQEAVQNVRTHFNRIREWVTARETELIESIDASTQVISRELNSLEQNLTTLSSTTKLSIHEIGSHLDKVNTNNNNNNNNETTTLNQLEFLKNTKKYIDSLNSLLSSLQQNNDNNNNNLTPKHTITLEEFEEPAIKSFIEKIGKIAVKSEQFHVTQYIQVRDYTQLLPDGKQKAKRIYGPQLGENFGRFNNPEHITIIPKHLFETNKNINTNNNNTNTNTASSASSSSSTPQNQLPQPPYSNDDIIVVSNANCQRIVLIEKTSGRVKSIIAGNERDLNYPIGNAIIKPPFHPNLLLLTTEYYGDCVSCFDITTGEAIKRFTHPKMQRPWGIAVNQAGHIIVANYNSNVVLIHTGHTNNISEFGSLIKVVGENDGVVFNHPLGVAVNSKSELIVSSQHKIDILNSDYKLIKSFGSYGKLDGQFNNPNSLCVDVRDNILVAEYNGHRVQVFDREGNWIATFGKEGQDDGCLNYPSGIAVDNESGDIMVTDQMTHTIKVF